MKLFKIDKPYSWLQWPVTVLSCTQDLHITAKFFGSIELDESAIEIRIDKGLFLPNRLFEWKPTIFGDYTYVLELTRVPPALFAVHSTFSIVKDQFTPWRPHITVPKDYWELVKEKNLTPQSEMLRLGEIELYLYSPTERCSVCKSPDFSVIRDMTSRRVCKCGHSWPCPPKAREL